jgi:pimeloyl-ACP methyl ester carboxylesterase
VTKPQDTSNSAAAWKTVITRTNSADGVDFAYRELGPDIGTPVVFLPHLAAVLDNWDPRVVDGIVARRRVITFDNRGIGASTGTTPTTIEAMADDAVTFIRALGLNEVDLFGFSLGGMIAQVMAQKYPRLVRKVILAGTGPAGGEGIDKVTRITYLDMVRGALTRQDPKQFLFFTRTARGRQAGRPSSSAWANEQPTATQQFPCGPSERSSRRSTAGQSTSPQTSLPSVSPCSPSTATATGWCPARTPSTSTGDCRIASSCSTPMPGTAASSSSTRTSSTEHSRFSDDHAGGELFALGAPTWHATQIKNAATHCPTGISQRTAPSGPRRTSASGKSPGGPRRKWARERRSVVGFLVVRHKEEQLGDAARTRLSRRDETSPGRRAVSAFLPAP